MIAALVNAGDAAWRAALDRPRGAAPTTSSSTTLQYDDGDGRTRLAHSWRAGALVKPGLALDHAAMMRAALALHEARNLPGRARASRAIISPTRFGWAQALEEWHVDPRTRACSACRRATPATSSCALRRRPTTPFRTRIRCIFRRSCGSAALTGDAAGSRARMRCSRRWRRGCGRADRPCGRAERARFSPAGEGDRHRRARRGRRFMRPRWRRPSSSAS